MLKLFKEKQILLKRWFADCKDFFDKTEISISERNWSVLHPMSLLYLAYLCFYLLIVCRAMNIPLQTHTVVCFTAAHAIFTLWVFFYGKKTPKVWVVETAITLFAAQILGLSGFLGVTVFPTDASFLFPLCIVLMVQIYTRRLIYPILEVTIPSVIYLICCFMTKDTYHFILDVISISIALAITGAALFSIISYKLSAYHAQTALQKMCALDPVTGVNNKPTFEYLVEEFLHSCPQGSHALAICDLDDFKNINDNFGHRAGDKVIDAFAAQMHAIVDHDPDFVAGRFGGDEFLLFIKNYDEKDVILKKLEKLTKVHSLDFMVTCSIGIACSASGKISFQQYFDVADKSLYRAKSDRQGRICVSDADGPRREEI